MRAKPQPSQKKRDEITQSREVVLAFVPFVLLFQNPTGSWSFPSAFIGAISGQEIDYPCPSVKSVVSTSVSGQKKSGAEAPPFMNAISEVTGSGPGYPTRNRGH
jgi:hypothetical protein